jgi:hypothetical protein
MLGGRGANITADEFKRAAAAVAALRHHWRSFASAAALVAEPRGGQRLAQQTSVQQAAAAADRGVLLERMARLGQASDGPAQVVRWLGDVLTMYAGDAVPAEAEAVRVITGWASSMNDHGLGVAPDLAAMPSLTTLVPHYDVGLLCVCVCLSVCVCVCVRARLVLAMTHDHACCAAHACTCRVHRCKHRPSCLPALLLCLLIASHHTHDRRTCCMP